MIVVTSVIISALMYSTPYIFGALGGVISEKSGVVNIGIEGMMTVGAFTGAALCYFVPGAPWLAFVLAGVVFWWQDYQVVYLLCYMQWLRLHLKLTKLSQG